MALNTTDGMILCHYLGIVIYSVQVYQLILTIPDHVTRARADDKDDLRASTPDYTGTRNADLSLGQSL